MGVVQRKCVDCGHPVVALLGSYFSEERPIPLLYSVGEVVGYSVEDGDNEERVFCKKCWREKNESRCSQAR